MRARAGSPAGDPVRICSLMRHPTASLTFLLVLFLPLAVAAQDEPAAKPPAANQVELRLEQRLLSLDLLAYNQTRDRERQASQHVADVLGRYLLNRPLPGALELSEFCLALLVFFGLGSTGLGNTQVVVDIVIERFSWRLRTATEAVNATRASRGREFQ